MVKIVCTCGEEIGKMKLEELLDCPSEFVKKSKAYSEVIEHRKNCKKWKEGKLCLECFGGGLREFVKSLINEIPQDSVITREKVKWLLEEIEREESEITAQIIGYADTSKSYYELCGFGQGLKFAKELIKKAFDVGE